MDSTRAVHRQDSQDEHEDRVQDADDAKSRTEIHFYPHIVVAPRLREGDQRATPATPRLL